MPSRPSRATRTRLDRSRGRANGMAKVKVSGCLWTWAYAEAWCRIAGYLDPPKRSATIPSSPAGSRDPRPRLAGDE